MYGSLARLPLLQLLDGAQNAQPHGFPLHVAGFQKGIGALGSMSRRVLAVLVDQEPGRAVDVAERPIRPLFPRSFIAFAAARSFLDRKGWRFGASR